MLKLENVTKSYTQGTKNIEVLKDLNFEVSSNQSKAIMGKSGSGKSTLLSLISGILKADSGEVTLDGHDYSKLNESKLTHLRATHIGFIFQNFHLVTYLNALENVMLPAKVCGQKNVEKKAQQLLEKVGLIDRLDHLPRELSGGENQRVAIARSLIHSPKLILADEPSGSLDEQTGDEVMKVLFEMIEKSHIALILVTHSREVASRCQSVTYLETGKITQNDH